MCCWLWHGSNNVCILFTWYSVSLSMEQRFTHLKLLLIILSILNKASWWVGLDGLLCSPFGSTTAIFTHFRHLWEYKSLDYLYVCTCLFYCIFCDWPTFWLQELLELSQSGDVFVRGTSRLVKLSPDQEHLKRPQSFIYKSEMSQIILALLSEVW